MIKPCPFCDHEVTATEIETYVNREEVDILQFSCTNSTCRAVILFRGLDQKYQPYIRWQKRGGKI